MLIQQIVKPSKLYAYQFDPNIQEKFLEFVKSFKGDPLKEMRDLKTNPVKFCKFLCKTVSKDPETKLQTITMFELMPAQEHVLNQLFHEVFLGQKSCAFLKSRQQGASWIIAVLKAHISIFYPNQTLLLTTKDEEALFIKGDPMTLMGKVEFILDNLPKWFKEQAVFYQKVVSSKLTINVNASNIKGQTGENAGSGQTAVIGTNDEFDLNDSQDAIQASMEVACGATIYMSTLKKKGSLFSGMVKNKAYLQIRLSWRDDLRVKDHEKFKADMISKIGVETWNREYDMKHSDNDEDYLITGRQAELMESLNIAYYDKYDFSYFPVVAGLDCAGQGKDLNVLRIRKGPYEIATYTWPSCFAEQSYKNILVAWQTHQFKIVAFDRIGVGFAMEGEFDRHKDTCPFYTVGVISSTQLMDNQDNVLDSVTGLESKIVYLNLRSRLWWEYAQRFRKTVEGTALEHELLFVKDPRVLDEIQLITYSGGKKVQIIAKEDLRKKLKKYGKSSPDFADADVYTIYALEQYMELLEYEYRYKKN